MGAGNEGATLPLYAATAITAIAESHAGLQR